MDLKSIFNTDTKKIRYAIVALGDISQEAMMPGISHTGNSEITAFVTGDPEKAAVLKEKYGVESSYGYEQYPELLRSGKIDAVYIATPNWRHAEFAVPALQAGIHVLLEKPMEMSVDQCEKINDAQKQSGAKLMIAYRLHFEPSTLALIEDIRAGKLGELRYFSASFAQMVDPNNHRAINGLLAGPLYDMGTYPINAARYVFGGEPTEVISAVSLRYADSKLSDSADTVAVTLRFPKERIAQFVVSYSAGSNNSFIVSGTKGTIEMRPGFTYGEPMEQFAQFGDKKEHRSFKATDQFGGEMKYFSECIFEDREPEPNAQEGIADVRILEAIVLAYETCLPVRIDTIGRSVRIDTDAQVQKLSKVTAPKPVNTASPVEKN